MDDLGHNNIDEEIRNSIFYELQKRGGTVRKVVLNCECADEALFDRVLADMIQKGEVRSDGNFIFLTKTDNP